MEAQQLYMDTISHNLSNVNTTGFKRTKIEFQDLMYQIMREPGVRNFEGSMAPAGIQTGLGVKPAATQFIFEQGSLLQTGNSLDWAIQGEGFFQILLPNGEIGYTRAGDFKMDSQGRIVTSNGYFLEPQVTIPQEATEITITQDGSITVKVPGQVQPQNIGH